MRYFNFLPKTLRWSVIFVDLFQAEVQKTPCCGASYSVEEKTTTELNKQLAFFNLLIISSVVSCRLELC